MKWMRAVLFLAAATTVACAPPAKSGATRNANLITAEEIAASQVTTAYDAVRNLRPMFLRSRGQTTFDPGVAPVAVVFLDGHRYGDVETLKTMSVQSIREIRFLTPSDATTKYGTGFTAGIIEVLTK